MLALFLSFVGVTLIVGFIGVSLLMLNIARVQDAADSATLAAAREAVTSTKFIVEKYDRTCVWDSKNNRTVCTDNLIPEVVELTGDVQSLFPDQWLKEADCDGRPEDAHVNKPGHWKVCTWGAAEKTNNTKWYLDPQVARTVALQYLSQNLNDNKITSWRVVDFQVDNNLQPPRVRMEVEAQLQNALLQAITRKPITMRIISWSQGEDRTLPIGASQ